MGDGVPATYEDEVGFRHEAALQERHEAARRLRVVFFDPATRRFSSESTFAAALDAGPRRFRVGLQAGYTALMGHHHGAADAVLAWRLGLLAVEGRLGAARADAPYDFYPDWQDRHLYHALAGARWWPDRAVAPFVGAAAEVYAPVAFGGRVHSGVQWTFLPGWTGALEAHAALLTTGPAWGVALGLARAY